MPVPNSATSRADLLGVFSAASPQMGRFIARRILPELPVTQDRGEYSKLPVSAFLADPGDGVLRKRMTARARSTTEMLDGDYRVQEYSFEEMTDLTDIARAAGRVDLEHIAAVVAAERVRLYQEIALASLLHDTTRYPLAGKTGLSLTTPWSDHANATPIDDVSAAKDALYSLFGVRSLGLQINHHQHRDLSQCDQILERGKYTSRQPGVLPEADLAVLLGIDEIVVARSFKLTSGAGAESPTTDNIWQSSFATVFVRSEATEIDDVLTMGRAAGLGRTLTWANLDEGQMVYTYDDESVNARLTVAAEHVDPHLVHPEAAFLLGGAVA